MTRTTELRDPGGPAAPGSMASQGRGALTLRDFVHLLRRRWYVFAVALLIAAAATVTMARDGGTFTTRTVVSFTLPAANTLTPDSGTTNESIITFAGTVATQVNNGRPAPRYSHGDAPFYGAGVREGVLVGLRDVGTQWGPSYGEAIIDVQIVGRTYEWVQSRQREILAEITGIAAAEQNAGIETDQRIAVSVEPLTKRIEHITATRSAQLAAVVAMTVAAVIAGAGIAILIDRRVAGSAADASASRRGGRSRLTEGDEA